MWPGELMGQGWPQAAELGLAFILSALIGLEREVRQKSAGLRTHTLVGVSAALFMLISKYGFTNILDAGRVVVDPSRVAAQVVSGIGFIGGGLIFVRRDSVRGLTTAAIVWLTASVGMACGAGLPILALVVTGGHFIVVFVFPYVERNLPRSRWTPSTLRVSYEDGRDVLADVLVACTKHDFAVSRLRIEKNPGPAGPSEPEDLPNPGTGAGHPDATPGRRIVTVALEINGTGSVSKLASRLADIGGVVSVHAGDSNVTSD